MRYTEFIKDEELVNKFIELLISGESHTSIGKEIGIYRKTVPIWGKKLGYDSTIDKKSFLQAKTLWKNKQHKEALDILFVINKNTGIIINKITWSPLSKKGKEAGSIRKTRDNSRIIISLFSNHYYRSRILLAYFNGLDIEDLSWEADHKNHNTLDDSSSNLRAVSKSINCSNRKLREDNTSGHVGVFYQGGTYQVIINGNNYGSGYTYEEACKKADEVYKELGYHKNHGRTQDELEADW